MLSLEDEMLAEKMRLAREGISGSSLWDTVKRQLGLTARYIIEGATSLPETIGNAANYLTNQVTGGINAVAGTNIPPLQSVSQTVQNAISGLPQPQGAMENIVGAASRGAVAAGTSAGIGGTVSAAPGVTGAVGRVMASQPGVQIASGAGAGTGSQAVAEAGGGLIAQTVGGVVGGLTAGGLALLAGKVSDKVSTAIQNKRIPQARIDSITDDIIEQAAKDSGQNVDDIPVDYLKNLKQQVSDSLKKGQKLDAAAILRQKDFKDLGMEGTLGQVGRDPTQFAMERNLRGVSGAGEPLMNRFTEQNQQLHSLFDNKAKNAYQSGKDFDAYLSGVDDSLQKQVSQAYEDARASSGAASEVNLTGLAQDYANILDDFQDKIPAAVKNRFESYGLISGDQKKVMTVDDAEKLLKLINSHKSNDPATNLALDRLRLATKNAVIDTTDDVFSAARSQAAKRFALQDAVPALKDASAGKLSADDFVSKYIINGETDEVRGLAGLLDKARMNDARAQISEYLRRAAFGEDAAGDAKFSPARYSKALRDLGPEKLSAFFGQDEVNKFFTIARVGSYIESHPNAAAVNTSNTASALANLGQGFLGRILEKYIPGGRLVGAAIDSLKENARKKSIIDNAIKASPQSISMSSLPPRSSVVIPVGTVTGMSSNYK